MKLPLSTEPPRVGSLPTGYCTIGGCNKGGIFGDGNKNSKKRNRAFSHDVTAAILVFQTSPVGVELFVLFQ